MVGVFSGFNTTGNNNTFLGANAGNSNIAGGSNIYLSTGYPGPAPESNTIRIGHYPDQNQVFIDPILPNKTMFTSPNIPVLTIATTTGQLGWQYISTGGGNVMGSCTSPAGGTYLTGWAGSGLSSTVGCSSVFQQATTNFVGIGTVNPTTPLEVGGEITADTRYDITSDEFHVLSIDNLPVSPSSASDGNLFVGISAGAVNVSNFPSSTGINNTFTGYQAGSHNTKGGGNTFTGSAAGSGNVGGSGNTFTGFAAGIGNNTGSANTFLGESAGKVSNSDENVYLGYQAGVAMTGPYNVCVGVGCGNVPNTGSSNIYVGNGGAQESNTIRIGMPYTNNAQTQNATYIAGIFGGTTNPANSPVCIGTDSKLFSVSTGCGTGSSLRLKEQILDMGDSSSKLFELRPVTFYYKPKYDDGSHLLHYGLIAEEVAQLSPEMVGYDKDGQPSSISQ